MSVEKIIAAKQRVKEANELIQELAKSTLDDLIRFIFNVHPGMLGIEWAQKSSEYDDQGIYYGVYGPVLLDLNDHDDSYPNWLYRGEDVPTELAELKTLLDSLGPEVLVRMFGDEEVVTVTRDMKFSTRYVGY